MHTLDLIQGSPEWAAARTSYFCASEAPAMLGFSQNVKRNELLHMKATLSEQEFSDWVQRNVLDKGHEIEAMARPIAEAIMGDDLYPATGVVEVEGMRLLASYDGITMDESYSWENKQQNADLRGYIIEHGDLPDSHWPQVEHQAIVSKASRILFTVSDGTKEGTSHIWYESRPARRSQVIDGWKQFAKDLAEYQPAQDPPKPEGRAPESLPALLIEVTGMVTASNLPAFKEHAIAVFTGIKTDLQTDADFSDAEKTVKWCGEVESKLEAAKQHALSQTASIDELFRTIDAIKAEARTKRLELDKLVKARKEAIRTELVMGAQRKLQEHLATANASLGKPYLSAASVDFAGAIRGLKTISSLRNAVDTALSSAKIVIDQSAEKVRANLAILSELASGVDFLFADASALVLKAPEDLTAIVKSRIAEHQQAENRRLEAERERIRAEEQAKAQREAQDAARRESESKTPAARIAIPDNAHASALPPVPEVLPHPCEKSHKVTLGQINAILAPIQISASGLAELGIQSVCRDRSAVMYLQSDIERICGVMIDRLQQAAIHAREIAEGGGK